MKIIQEHVVLSEERPFLVSIFEEPDLSYPFHHHQDAYELTMTLGLSGTRMVGDSTEQFACTDIVLMAPGVPHCWQDHGIRDTSIPHKVAVVQFLRSLFPSTNKPPRHFHSIYTGLEQAQYGLELIGEKRAKARAIMDRLDETHSLSSYQNLLEVLQLFGENRAVRRLCSDGYLQPRVSYEADKLERILAYIQAHFSRKLPIVEVAEQVHLSPSAFSHYFKKRTLKSFTHFVLELRLGKAAQLLQYTDMPVTRVGYECGFQSLSHFNQAFRRKYERSPLQFRKQALGM